MKKVYKITKFAMRFLYKGTADDCKAFKKAYVNRTNVKLGQIKTK